MFAQRLLQNLLRIIGIKLPIEGYWINVVPPAENALVGTGDIGRVLHTLVRRNAVEGVFVAPPLALEHRLGPAAEFRGGVAACITKKPGRMVDHNADIKYNVQDVPYAYVYVCVYVCMHQI